ERTEEDFAASYFGGDETQWDVLKNTTAFEVLSGDINAWNAMRNLANSGLANDAQYQQIQQYLDVESLIDYMILNLYTGNTDWPHHNWYVARRRQPAGTFKFFSWDAEHVLKSPTEDRSVVSDLNTPAELYDQLRRNNAEFRLRFADHVHRHFFNDGLCTTNQAVARYMARIREIDPAIVLESARWGDNAGNPDRAGNPPYERNVEWINELNRLLASWFPQRSTIALNQFRAINLYPSVAAPTFGQHGGRVARGFNLTMSAPAGLIYFTTNGVDPRVYLAGTPAPNAQRYTNTVSLSRTAVVKARALVGTNWSALNEATFTIEQLIVPLRITEIMYNPAGGDAYEFVELRNLGDTPLDVSGFSFTGITYVFPAGSVLSPGQTIVLATDVDPNAFAARYPGVVVFGYFSDRLANGGERIAIKGANGETITSVDYNDGGQWPHAADGFGYSLEVLDPLGNPDQPANWRASAALYGSPGLPTTQTPTAVIINEVMANNAGAVTNAGTFPNWIELRNSTTTNVNLEGWSLSNDSNTRRFVFAPGTLMLPGAYVVVWCDFGTDTNSGIHAPIALERNGDTVSLYDPLTNRVDAISYGNQVADYTIGRIGDEWQLCSPTPNSLNIAATTALSTNVVLNEWLANPLPGADDWIELYNSSGAPASLYNFYIGVSNSLSQIQSLTFIPPLGYLQLLADEQPGPNHLDFKLPAAGGAITLYDASGTVLSRVNYGTQIEGVSQGRLPDGNVAIQSFAGTASP
ncbi:MAG TPA: lamin tail domain-containing protein, partial [Candidatus Binatia bacterium]|nr:lamin tail domain-containing protein [Candidatus Binatia bacterium]